MKFFLIISLSFWGANLRAEDPNDIAKGYVEFLDKLAQRFRVDVETRSKTHGETADYLKEITDRLNREGPDARPLNKQEVEKALTEVVERAGANRALSEQASELIATTKDSFKTVVDWVAIETKLNALALAHKTIKEMNQQQQELKKALAKASGAKKKELEDAVVKTAKTLHTAHLAKSVMESQLETYLPSEVQLVKILRELNAQSSELDEQRQALTALHYRLTLNQLGLKRKVAPNGPPHASPQPMPEAPPKTEAGGAETDPQPNTH